MARHQLDTYSWSDHSRFLVGHPRLGSHLGELSMPHVRLHSPRYCHQPINPISWMDGTAQVILRRTPRFPTPTTIPWQPEHAQCRSHITTIDTSSILYMKFYSWRRYILYLVVISCKVSLCKFYHTIIWWMNCAIGMRNRLVWNYAWAASR